MVCEMYKLLKSIFFNGAGGGSRTYISLYRHKGLQ